MNDTYTKEQVLAMFNRIVTNGCFQSETLDGKFKPERNYNIAKKILKSHLNIDYEVE